MKIGDKVSVVDENLSGIVCSVAGNMVAFRDPDGFTYTYAASQLVRYENLDYGSFPVEIKKEPATPHSKKHRREPLVLDLHFEKLVNNSKTYNSFERLMIQREKLLQTLEFCRSNRLKKLEVIHGIGDGVLQQMVNDVLEGQTGLNYYHQAVLRDESGSVMVEFN